MHKIKNIFLATIALSMLLGGFMVFTPATVNAATCYTELSPSTVQPITHNCPVAGSNVTYTDISGNSVNALGLPATRCFVSAPAAGPNGTRSYREQFCAPLEAQRQAAARENCTNTGGTWASTNICQCPANRFLQSNGSCGGSSSDNPSADTTEPSYTPNDCNDVNINQDNCGIIRYVVLAINVLSGLVTLVVVGSIIAGGIQYTTAGSDPQKISAAKNRIRNALIALFVFIFGYSFLNFLVPGGVL